MSPEGLREVDVRPTRTSADVDNGLYVEMGGSNSIVPRLPRTMVRCTARGVRVMVAPCGTGAGQRLGRAGCGAGPRACVSGTGLSISCARRCARAVGGTLHFARTALRACATSHLSHLSHLSRWSRPVPANPGQKFGAHPGWRVLPRRSCRSGTMPRGLARMTRRRSP